MKPLLFIAVIVLFYSCTNGDGVCCPRPKVEKLKDLTSKNDTITIEDFNSVDTIIYVAKK